MIDFIKWCFRNPNSTIITLIVLSGLGYFILDLVKALKSKK